MKDLLKGFLRSGLTKTGTGLVNHLGFESFSERSLILQGQTLSRMSERNKVIQNFGDVEFGVFSQWGEDGILDWLVQRVAMPCHRFVEFGVETFREANCRFLLQSRNWKGLVLDGSESNMAALRRSPTFWRHDLMAKAAFIDAGNINGLLEEAGFAGPLGILSIDIDGNDYWVWKAIDCVDPAIVVCEYNPIFGDTQPVTIPYDPGFQRFNAHYSGLYFGASIAALRHLAEKKGYVFVGTNTNGVNAFFVRADLAAPVLEQLAHVVAYPSRHRDSRDEAGNLSYVGGVDRFKLIAEMPVVDVISGQQLQLRSIQQPYSDGWLKGMS